MPTGTFPLFIDAPRVDNAIHYLSPEFGGFRVQGMVALGEGVMDRYQGLKATYARGPITAAAAYEQSKASAPAPGSESTVNRVFEVGGNYKFDSFSLYGGYQRGRDLTAGPRSQIQIGTLNFQGLPAQATDLSSYTVGVLVPTRFADLMANYTEARFKSPSGAEIKTGRAAIGTRYPLSKRTFLYGTIASMTGDLKDYVNEKQIYQLGLRHLF